MGVEKRRVLIVGGGFCGLFAARHMRNKFDVTVVDAKEFFEYTPGILRCFVKPAHFDSLSFHLAPVLEREMGVKFIWGEVKSIDGEKKTAAIKPIFAATEEEVAFDYCIISSGCNFNFLHKWGESLWFPTIYEDAIPDGSWSHIDERFLEGRRRHILEEHSKLKALNQKGATILVCGAGFIGVEWATELEYFFPNLKITIIDFLPNCLGPLPVAAQTYCDNYMQSKGIKCFYGVKYDPKDPEFWNKIELPNKADEIYLCMGVKASSHFMPKDTLSDKGPGGGGWVLMNNYLQVVTKSGKLFGNGDIFVVGDANYGCIGSPEDWSSGKGMYPVPKISYPGEEQTAHVCRTIGVLDSQAHGHSGCCGALARTKLAPTWWPWGAGMFATSLGVHDACFVLGANHNKGSGIMCVWGWPCAIQKELIETTKVDECKNNLVGKLIWYFVHETPVHLWGKGPFFA